jgi:hypothetical protein
MLSNTVVISFQLPNVEVTGVARLYGEASVWTVGLGYQFAFNLTLALLAAVTTERTA